MPTLFGRSSAYLTFSEGSEPLQIGLAHYSISRVLSLSKKAHLSRLLTLFRGFPAPLHGDRSSSPAHLSLSGGSRPSSTGQPFLLIYFFRRSPVSHQTGFSPLAILLSSALLHRPAWPSTTLSVPTLFRRSSANRPTSHTYLVFSKGYQLLQTNLPHLYIPTPFRGSTASPKRLSSPRYSCLLKSSDSQPIILCVPFPPTHTFQKMLSSLAQAYLFSRSPQPLQAGISLCLPAYPWQNARSPFAGHTRALAHVDLGDPQGAAGF